jgi:hypothetical protein
MASETRHHTEIPERQRNDGNLMFVDVPPVNGIAAAADSTFMRGVVF